MWFNFDILFNYVSGVLAGGGSPVGSLLFYDFDNGWFKPCGKWLFGFKVKLLLSWEVHFYYAIVALNRRVIHAAL